MTSRLHLLARCAGAVGLVAVSASGLAGQEDVASAGAGVIQATLVQDVAEAWGVDESLISVQVSGGIPEGADSVTATVSSAAKWIATFHIGDRTIRRFASVGHAALVEVAATGLRRGAVIDSVSIERALRVLPGPPVELSTSALGMVAERSISTGEVLRHPAVRPPYLIRGGEQVEAVLEQGAVRMTVLAEALGAARAGDVVQVRLASGLRRRARATRPGVVTLIPGGE